MIGDDLVGRRAPLEPFRDRRVQLGAHALRHAGVRRVANQHVVEAKRLLSGELRPVRDDQPATHERDEPPSASTVAPSRAASAPA